MSKRVQILLLISSIIILLFIIRQVSKNKVNIRYSVLWIIFSCFLILISIFPGIIYSLNDLLGIQTPVNTLFLLLIFILFCLSFYLFIKLSKHNEEILNLNYEIAKLKKEVEDSKKK